MMNIPLNAKNVHDNTTGYNMVNRLRCPRTLDIVNDNTHDIVSKAYYNSKRYILDMPISGTTEMVDDTELQYTPKGPFYSGRDMALGANYFMQAGKCNQASDEKCRGRNKWIYIRNIPTGKIPMLGDFSVKGMLQCSLNGAAAGKGLVPSILEDISDIQPLSLMQNITSSTGGNYGSSTCKLMKYPVGTNIYDSKMECTDEDSSCNARSWWYEERCTPSYNFCKDSDNQLRLPTSMNPMDGKANLCEPETESFCNHEGGVATAAFQEDVKGDGPTRAQVTPHTEEYEDERERPHERAHEQGEASLVHTRSASSSRSTIMGGGTTTFVLLACLVVVVAIAIAVVIGMSSGGR